MASINPTSVNCPQENYTSKKGYLQFVVTNITQTDGGTNQTTIDWQLKVRGTPWVNLHARYLAVGGKELVPLTVATVSSWSDGQVLNSGSTTFNNNADGSLSLSLFMKQLFYYNWSQSRWDDGTAQSVSATLTCSTIPRYPVLSYNTVSTTLNTMTCGLSNSRAGTMTKFQVARTSDNVTIIDTTCNGSFSFTVTGLTPNTDQSGKFKVRAYANGGWGDWLTLYSDYDNTKALPTATVTKNVGLEDSATIQFSNLNYINSFRFTVDVLDSTTNQWVTKGIAERTNITTNNYLFKLSETEITTLLNYFKGSVGPWVHLVLYVNSNGIEYPIKNSENGNFPIGYTIPNTSKYLPDFSSSKVTSVIDTLHTAIKGNTKFIKNHNKLNLTIAPMGLKYNASGSGYSITVGSKSKWLGYSSSNQTTTIDNVDGNTLKVVATDSRGKTTSITQNITLIDYFNPTFTELEAIRQNGIDNYAIIRASGKYTNWSGLSQTNSISKVEYRYKLATAGDDKYSAWTEMTTVTNSSGNWSIETLLPVVFTNTERYYIQLRITDKLEIVNSQPFILSTANVFLWKDLKNKYLGINKKPTCALDVNGDVNVDGVITSDSKVEVATDMVVQGTANIQGVASCENVKFNNLVRNTTDTWMPVFNNGVVDYTLRKFGGSVKSTEYPTDNDCLVSLDFLSWWNGAYAVGGSSNLKHCHQGQIQAKPDALYGNADGTTGSITLSKSCANYDLIEIIFGKGYKYFNCARCTAVDNRIVSLVSAVHLNDTDKQILFRNILFSGTSITTVGQGVTNFGSTTCQSWNSNEIKIFKVLGYKIHNS